MYNKRIKILVTLIALFLAVCLLRLAQMQLLSGSFYRYEIAKLKRQRGRSRQLKTVRGTILDRKGRVLAVDEPLFQLNISYTLTCFLDERVQNAKLLKAATKPNPQIALSKARKELDARLDDLEKIIDKFTYFGLERADVVDKITKLNDRIWNLRVFQAWRQNCPQSEVLSKYKNNLFNVQYSEFVADFQKHNPDPNDRLRLVSRTDIHEMHKPWPLLELKTGDDIFTAQLEFMDVDGISILPKAHRVYPYGSVAAQTIGWVGPEQDRTLFADDKLLSYLQGELSGRRPGVEYVCETILRGRRGEVFYDIDNRRIERARTRFGSDVTLTLDIELQKKIEEYLTNCELNPNCETPAAAVVVDVATGDILALVSIPVFDLNRIRYDYADIEADAARPLINRAIYEQYPPGSAVKPLILIAGLETKKITPGEVISCPARKAPKGWPSCWIYNEYEIGHDGSWPNNASNAIKGSCNIYFSRLANRIEPLTLQKWLFDFGYGHKALSPSSAVLRAGLDRNFKQAQGQISNTIPRKTILTPDQLPPLEKGERRWFGIGQGNLRVTPLQAANAMAVLARGGLYKPPRLFVEDANDSIFSSTALNISPQNMAVVREGMYAVVNEYGGTAYRPFRQVDFTSQGLKFYGKTGSTEQPDNAWFAGFAEDSKGRSIAIAVVVEQGQSGAKDAAPLARDIIQFCTDAGYIGKPRLQPHPEL